MPAIALLHAYSLGAMADAVLRDATHLEIVSVFSRSVYARDGGGNLVCFVKSGMEPGPLNVLCSNWPENGVQTALAQGESLTRVTESVWRSRNLSISLASAVLWTPAPWPRTELGSIQRGIAAFQAGFAECIPRDSLASLFFPDSASSPDPLAAALFAYAVPCIQRLDGWLRESPQPFDSQFPSLLGLGKGLTPSGDDFLGGALLAMQAVGMMEARAVLARHVADAAGSHTNAISAAHLSAAIRGLGAEALHLFIIALMQGGDGMRSVAPRLSLIGHTSGWDAAAGAVLVLGALAEMPPFLLGA